MIILADTSRIEHTQLRTLSNTAELTAISRDVTRKGEILTTEMLRHL